MINLINLPVGTLLTEIDMSAHRHIKAVVIKNGIIGYVANGDGSNKRRISSSDLEELEVAQGCWVNTSRLDTLTEGYFFSL